MLRGSIRNLVVIACSLSCAAAVTAFAQDRQPGTGGGPERAPGQTPPPGPGRGPGQGAPGGPGGERGPGGQNRQGPNVGGSMRGMNRAAGQLAQQVADASKKEENLKLINDMQRGCVSAKGQPVPNDVLERIADPAAKAKAAEEYRHRLMKALRLMVEIESDIDAGNGDAAKAKLDELGKLRDESHKALGVAEE